MKRSTATVTAAAGAAVVLSARARRRRRLHAIATALRETVLPPDEVDPAAPPVPQADEAHAPGHQHLGPPSQDRRRRRRPSWPERADRTGHPGRMF